MLQNILNLCFWQSSFLKNSNTNDSNVIINDDSIRFISSKMYFLYNALTLTIGKTVS